MSTTPTIVALSAGIVAPVAMGAAAVTEDKVYFVAILVATVVGVAGCIAWIDARIERRIKSHEVTEQELDTARHAEVLGEIRHVKELFERATS